MLLQDYGAIIIQGICDSPNFLIYHFRREIKKLKDDGYEEEEIKYDFDEVFKLIRKQVEDNYNNDFGTYEKYRDIDRSLPKEKRYNYPKPELDKIPVLTIKYPAYKHDLTGLTKRFI
ncbi:MAG: hypothetical protein IPI68_05115 [Chitinophagaceae bacterium]|nr:hypothetical protein [Chitinophagaceae bacterium]